MVFNIERNKNYTSREDFHKGKCPKFNKLAKISIKLNGKKSCKTDLALTFSCYLCNCSLLKENDNICVDCPLFEEYKNNHNF